MLRKVAPRAWAAAHEDIERVLEHDSGLHLPFYLPYERARPQQPTAFSHVEYRFRTDGLPQRERKAQPSGMTAITALGNYDATDGELILWEDQIVVNFPPGSTFLLPKWMNYSFTAVEEPGYQMILAQSCDAALSEFVANGFSTIDFGEEDPLTPKLLSQKAEAAAAKYSTCEEYDEHSNSSL
ncbi:hypothetical protein C8F04DRAFT_950823 [Mycena alexandri]|uniref:Uncharacterized protein n=1 Tax=Mycena alexandri TaxID=1745969 RepID=A0AAD6X4L7_9AGAR|nr:hypothetical protein C8F04DRAFT_950823 [Mycena alexandri]